MLGLGAVHARPLVIADGGVDRLAVRHAALLTLAYDARVLDQYYADAFLSDIKRRLEQFYFLTVLLADACSSYCAAGVIMVLVCSCAAQG